MINLKDFDQFSEKENESHVIILIDSGIKIQTIDLLQESIWKESTIEKGIKIRLEPSHTKDGFKHVHVSRSEHINTKSKQVSWNIIGTIHDKKKFNFNFKGLERAKRAARAALKLPDNIVLETYQDIANGNLILESEKAILSSNNIIILIAKKINGKQLLCG